MPRPYPSRTPHWILQLLNTPKPQLAAKAWEADEEGREDFQLRLEEIEQKDLVKRVVPLMPDNMIPIDRLRSIVNPLRRFASAAAEASADRGVKFRLQDLDPYREWKARCAAVQEAVDRISRSTRDVADMDDDDANGVGDENDNLQRVPAATAHRNAYIPTLRGDIQKHVDSLVDSVGAAYDNSLLDGGAVDTLYSKYTAILPSFQRVDAACVEEGDGDGDGDADVVPLEDSPLTKPIPDVGTEGAVALFKKRWKKMEGKVVASSKAVRKCQGPHMASHVIVNGVAMMTRLRATKQKAKEVAASRRRFLEAVPAALLEYRGVTRKQQAHIQACFDATRQGLEKIRRRKGELMECQQELKRLDRIEKALEGLDATVEVYRELRRPIEDLEVKLASAKMKEAMLRSRRRNADADKHVEKRRQLKDQLAALKNSTAYLDACTLLRERSTVLPEVDSLTPEINPLHGTKACMLPTYQLDRDFEDVTEMGGGGDGISGRHLLLKTRLKGASGGDGGWCVLKQFVGEDRARLRRTAHIIAGLNHPNIIRLLGVVRDDDIGCWYLMLPHYEESDLRHWIEDTSASSNSSDGDGDVDMSDDNTGDSERGARHDDDERAKPPPLSKIALRWLPIQNSAVSCEGLHCVPTLDTVRDIESAGFHVHRRRLGFWKETIFLSVRL